MEKVQADTRLKGVSDSTFYLTTPIYYVNDAPHIGHGSFVT